MKTIILLTLTLLSLKSFSQKTTYRVVVKFGSMCCGVPSDKPLLDYITAFKKKNKIKKINSDRIGPMGKEGEYDMAFSLKELKKQQVEIFVKEVTTLAATMKEQGYANVEENVEVDLAALGRATIIKKSL
jgi:transcriptional regulatory protein LevR